MSLWPQQLVEMMPTIQVRGGSHLLGIDANDSGGDRFTNTCGACDVNHLSCVHGGVQDSDGDRLTNTCPMWIPSGVHGGAACEVADHRQDGGTCTESHVFDSKEAQASVHCTLLMDSEANDAMPQVYDDVHLCSS